MKRAQVVVGWILLMSCSLFSPAQQIVTSANSVVPPLMRFAGVLNDANGKPAGGTVGVTFLLYKDEQGGAPLWVETQNVTPDKTGHYTVMLGSASSTGLPSDIFVAGEARWLAVQPQGQAEQARVLLLSVPYALKAGDAQTLGGLPASAFALAVPANTASLTVSPAASAAAANVSVPPPASSDVTTTGGTVNAIPLFSTASDIENSILTQTGKAAINVGGKLNLFATGTATAAGGKNSQPQNFVASAFNSATSAAVPQTFRWQAEPASNDTAAPSATLNLLYAAGSTNPAETGLNIASNGLITFAAGQTFPGTSTLTGVTAGTDLTGGGTTGNVTVNLNVAATDARYAQLGANDTFSGELNLNNKEILNATSNFDALDATQAGGSGDGIHGNTNSTTGSGVVGNASAASGSTAGVVGNSTSGTGVGVQGNSPNIGVSGTATGSSSYGVEGTSPNVGVFGNATGTSGIGIDGHGASIGVKGVATASTGLAGLFQGNVQASGFVHSGNGTGFVSANNLAATNCVLPLTPDVTSCQIPNMELQVSTFGGPVLVSAEIGGVLLDCYNPNFYLTIDDSQFLAFENASSDGNGGYLLNAHLEAITTPAAGTHTFRVLLSDDDTKCAPSLVTRVSAATGGEVGGVAFPGASRTLLVREF